VDHVIGDEQTSGPSIATPVGGLAAPTFVDLYHGYADRIFRFALARTRSRAVAEDIVGDTLLRAIERFKQFDPTRGSFTGWIFAIANREIINHQRYQLRLRRLLPRLWSRNTTDDDLADAVIREEQVVAIHRALAQRSRADQEVIALRFGAGLSHHEIAEALGISTGTARVRLHRAVERLRNDLNSDQPEHGQEDADVR